MSFTPRPNTSTAAGREKRKAPMISAGDAEFPRDYHTLAAGGGRGARRFQDNTNGGFTSSSLDRRHNSVAAKSLEALNSIHKADIERQRDALMDLQKNKYTNSPGSLSQGTTAGRQVPATPQSLTLTRASVFFFFTCNNCYKSSLIPHIISNISHTEFISIKIEMDGLFCYFP